MNNSHSKDAKREGPLSYLSRSHYNKVQNSNKNLGNLMLTKIAWW